METEWMYAYSVNQQANPNTTKKENSWADESNAVGDSANYMRSFYDASYICTKKNNKNKCTKYTWTYTSPRDVTAHDFRLNIDPTAYIKKITFEVRMRADKSGSGFEFPRARFCIYGGGYESRYDNTSSTAQTGFHNGYYIVNPSMKLSTSWQNCSYVMDESALNKARITPSNINHTLMGVDLLFDWVYDVNTNAKNVKYPLWVDIKWIRVKIEWDSPQYSLSHDGADTSSSYPRVITSGSNHSVAFNLKQHTKARGGNQCLKLDIPWGISHGNITTSKGSFNPNTNIWSVNCDGVTDAYLYVPFSDYTVGTQAITLTALHNDANCTSTAPHPPNKSYYFRTELGSSDDYGELVTQMRNPPFHKRHEACFTITGDITSSNDEYFMIDTVVDEGFTFDSFNASLDENLSTKGLELLHISDIGRMRIGVPESLRGQKVRVTINYCFKPTKTGHHRVTNSVMNGGGSSNTVYFDVLEPYTYHFGRKTITSHDPPIFNIPFHEELLGFRNHRIASELETGAYILPCKTKDNDAVMVQGHSNLHMYKWEEVDYIGCVPVEHHHFNPKSTYKDKLLDSHYKNKRYMGKELAPDEDITLNIRLHPHQVTTIQGLIDMDKPIPINANHKCFESDALNHRGWAEIYSITTEETNPHWYKCDIDVKYLTHNLNTRMKINKGVKSFNYNMPNLMLETVESGNAISSYGQTESGADYFIVDTDGGYMYSEETTAIRDYEDDDGKIVFFVLQGDQETIDAIIEEYGADKVHIIECRENSDDFNEHLSDIIDEGYTIVHGEMNEPIRVSDTDYINKEQRNIFLLDEGQQFDIKSREPLSLMSQVRFDWSSTLLKEVKENAVRRIVRLVDKATGNAMFEYEYSDFDFDDYKDGLGYIKCNAISRVYRKGDYESNAEEMYIAVNSLEEFDDEDEEVTKFGSSITLQLNTNKLHLEDTGYSGMEISKSFELEGSEYYYEVYWQNNNTDGEDEDIVAYVDLSVQDSLLATRYASKYGNMIVSPFPIVGKTLIFQREGEEGVLFYYENDEEEFSYLIEPYYVYHNGVDLRNSAKASVFNLNYGYKTVYIENGLVSLGINRITGQMFLGKWDNDANSYITLFTFKLNNCDDVNINSISDDKIELQASNTLISMYRGHPYVILKHQLEDINIYNHFGRVWSEQVNDDLLPYPTYFELLNTANMLPPCVGGTKTLDGDCLKAYECGDTITCEDGEEASQIFDVECGDVFYCPELTEVDFDVELYREDPPTAYTTSYLGIENCVGLEDDDKIYFILNGDLIEDVVLEYDSEAENQRVEYEFQGSGAYEITAVFVGDSTRSYKVSDTITVQVTQAPSPPAPAPAPSPSEGCRPTTGDYLLTSNIKDGHKFKYRDGQMITYRLTRGGVPVCGETIEKVDFFNIQSQMTDSNGEVHSYNTFANWTPQKYTIGAYFIKEGKRLAITSANVEIVKTDCYFKVNKYAGTKGGTISIKLVNADTGNGIKNAKVFFFVDGLPYSMTTNEYGNVNRKINTKGNHTYRVRFNGSKYYNKAQDGVFKEKI